MSRTRWEMDPARSRVGFSVEQMMFATVRGRFEPLGGTIVVDEEDPYGGSVEVEIDAASVDTGLRTRDEHLRSEDFLHVEEHPTLTFRSTRVLGAPSEPGDRFAVEGELTIRGRTGEVVLDAVYRGRRTDRGREERARFEASTTFDRREWGLSWNRTLELGGVLVGHELTIELDIEVVRVDEEDPA